MSTYSLSGTGVQALSDGTTAIHVTITTLPAGLTHGRANPTNHFDIALIRFSDGSGYGKPIPVNGGPDWIIAPVGSTQLGYSTLNGAVISVDEIIGGTAPTSTPGSTISTLTRSDITPQSAESIGVQLGANFVGGGSSGAWPVANKAFFYPFVVQDAFTIASAFIYNGGVVSGHFDIGVYSEALARLASTGSTLQAGTSQLQKVALSLALLPGRYYLALAVDNTTAQVFNQVTDASLLRAWGCMNQLTAFALPNPATPQGSGQSGNVYAFGITRRTSTSI